MNSTDVHKNPDKSELKCEQTQVRWMSNKTHVRAGGPAQTDASNLNRYHLARDTGTIQIEKKPQQSRHRQQRVDKETRNDVRFYRACGTFSIG